MIKAELLKNNRCCLNCRSFNRGIASYHVGVCDITEIKINEEWANTLYCSEFQQNPKLKHTQCRDCRHWADDKGYGLEENYGYCSEYCTKSGTLPEDSCGLFKSSEKS